MFFRRLRCDDKKSPLDYVLSEATYRKNITKGSKLASSFELLYARKLPTMERIIDQNPIVSISEQVKDVPNRRLQKIMWYQVRKLPDVKIGDFVYFWQDKNGRFGPSKVIEITDNCVKILHDEKFKTSSFNCIRIAVPPLSAPIEEQEEEIIEGKENVVAPISVINEIEDLEVEILDDQQPLPWHCDLLAEEIQNSAVSFYTSFFCNHISTREFSTWRKKNRQNWKEMEAIKLIQKQICRKMQI